MTTHLQSDKQSNTPPVRTRRCTVADLEGLAPSTATVQVVARLGVWWILKHRCRDSMFLSTNSITNFDQERLLLGFPRLSWVLLGLPELSWVPGLSWALLAPILALLSALSALLGAPSWALLGSPGCPWALLGFEKQCVFTCSGGLWVEKSCVFTCFLISRSRGSAAGPMKTI